MDVPLSQERMESLRRRLLEDKAELEARIRDNEHYQLSISQRDSLNELSAYDNHPGDLGTEMFERSKDIALLERDAFRLSRINSALRRMETGEYGRCRACGKFIHPERLEAIPAAEYCVEHEPQQVVSHDRPAEEEFLHPPFGRTSMDEKDQTAFDGEDAWQIVSSWGNSNSPALSEENSALDYESMHIESEENEGFVEPIESFLATDITGRQVSVVRNKQYERYMDANEGEPLLEPDRYADE
jgi:YteA family regulatory protein